MIDASRPRVGPRHFLRSLLATAFTATVAMWVVAAIPNSANAAAQPDPVVLGENTYFAVVAGISITNTGSTTVTGNVGVSPGMTVSGLPASSVTGIIHIGDDAAEQAQLDLAAAYNDVTTRPLTSTIAAALGGTTLTPGVYETQTGQYSIDGNLTLDAQGDPNAIFIVRGGNLTTGLKSTITLAGDARPCNVFFALSSGATLGANSTFRGNILSQGLLAANAGVTVGGRLLTGVLGKITLDGDTISLPDFCPLPECNCAEKPEFHCDKNLSAQGHKHGNDHKVRHHHKDRHHKDRGRLVTVQTLHTIEGVIGEDVHGRHHGDHHSWAAHHPKHHYKMHHKAHKKPHVRMQHKKQYQHRPQQRPRIAVAG
jgi:hypothetical protein